MNIGTIFNKKYYSKAHTGFQRSVKFTLASTRDRFPTVTASRLDVNAARHDSVTLLLTSKSALSKGTGNTYTITFRLNRYSSNTNATFIAENWPKKLRKPKVGSPVEFAILNIETL
jgi:hypothetical protein